MRPDLQAASCSRCHAPFEATLGPALEGRLLCLSCASVEPGVAFEELVVAAAVACPDIAPSEVAAAMRHLLGDLRRRALAAVN